MSINPPRRGSERGFGLVELVMFIVIVSIAVLGVLQALSSSARNSPDPMLRKQALAIAEGLLEEVRLAHFSYCDGNDPVAESPSTTSPASCTVAEGVGPEAGNSRPYDNVNDYVLAFGTPMTYSTDAAGNNFPNGYSATVTINPDSALGPAGAQISADATPANMNVLRITVAVSYPGGYSVVLDGYRTRYAPRSI
ncbi:hypothetical protein GTP23_20825 [Pseudoduganella sp. FT93W]|uniref:Type II secretion system protein n=1 Tax=Duganella fentianensis TaxID=2692177 RepID=A0A845I2H7_9BURK|nr:type II secretion system protein [Duganella fentianensis]MYN47493.1 hypothetical protein [Duganella fentianensis]